ncbi:saccharopine dehydrogenase NADP-binding domain-containing protein [Wenzhouxiangella sp. AB-CW3]|uniref:saccharopine dehydrogenase family protein n=1 Tax=Wenzhouxiangella sp. AB-CW3 TaxID=2771012 RepID=UPI00168AC146|nr:saccharopine dehydrogenase NADP-binding domain-containing protein [Wenzhouxiangella sp. AB-CW3]QOC21276.1 saccharopine dehydrogenase NADP-binding domain-containing protein [Wenzhouxiangella sp. AB-CW3]
MSEWMIYGANGYTGELCAREAVERGLRPVLAGRREEAVAGLASELGLEFRVFALDDADAVRRGLDGMPLVLHCAGPFSATSRPMVDGCLATGTHYLDITGEISVYQACHEREEEARAAGVILMPGVGFDIVPTDCLSAMLKQRLPDASELTLAFEAGGGPSPGTAKTSFEGLTQGGKIRRGGRLESVPLAFRTRDIPFAEGPRHGMTIPWGDVYTAYVSTGIPDVEVYLAVPPRVATRIRRMNKLRWLLALPPLKKAIMRRIERKTPGPDDDKRASTVSRVWGEVRNKSGQSVSAELHTPNGYDLTVDASVSIAAEVLGREAIEPGYFTPSLLLGADYVTHLKDVSVSFNQSHQDACPPG